MHAKLITIGVSHYCEKARWALELANIPYTEDAHAPVFHLPYAKAVGGRSVPILVTDTVIKDSTKILQWVGHHPASQWNPYSTPEALDWEERFDEVLGPHVRRVAYGLLLPHRELVVKMMHGDHKTWESRTIDIGYPAIAAGLRKSLKITPDGVVRSKAKILALLDEVGETVEDRSFLIGEELSAADITFASLFGPLVLPEKYGWKMPKLEEMPEDVSKMISTYREHPAGKYAMRIYDAYR